MMATENNGKFTNLIGFLVPIVLRVSIQLLGIDETNR